MDTIINFKIVQNINIMSDKITYKIVAMWGKKKKQGYLLPYSFDDDELAYNHADKLMPILPMSKADLVSKIKEQHPLTALVF